LNCRSFIYFSLYLLSKFKLVKEIFEIRIDWLTNCYILITKLFEFSCILILLIVLLEILIIALALLILFFIQRCLGLILRFIVTTCRFLSINYKIIWQLWNLYHSFIIKNLLLEALCKLDSKYFI
jgi:hypothetical protein